MVVGRWADSVIQASYKQRTPELQLQTAINSKNWYADPLSKRALCNACTATDKLRKMTCNLHLYWAPYLLHTGSS